MMFSNASGSVSRPRKVRLGWNARSEIGGSAIWPPAIWTFCDRTLASRSAAVRPNSAILSGSSHSRME